MQEIIFYVTSDSTLTAQRQKMGYVFIPYHYPQIVEFNDVLVTCEKCGEYHSIYCSCNPYQIGG